MSMLEARGDDFDVAVIGLGSVGAAALWRLATTTRLKVVGVEQFGIGHTRGSFSGESRVFRTAVHEGARYVPMLLRAHELWHQLQQEAGREILLETGMLAVDRPDHEPFITTMKSISDFDLPHRYFTTDELRRAYPQHIVGDGVEGVLDLRGGGLRSEVAVLAAVQRARVAGADVVTNEKVVGIDESGEHIEITTSTGRRIRAAQIVVASGSWAGELRPRLRELVTIRPVALTWFAPLDPRRYTPDVFPAFLRDEGDVHMFGVPTLDGFSVKVVSHNDDESVIPDTVDQLPTRLSRQAARQISANAQKLFSDLYPEPVRQSLHHDGFTASRIPIVDRDPSERIVTITGLSGHGFKLTPVLGEIARDLITGSRNSSHSADFSIDAHLAALNHAKL